MKSAHLTKPRDIIALAILVVAAGCARQDGPPASPAPSPGDRASQQTTPSPELTDAAVPESTSEPQEEQSAVQETLEQPSRDPARASALVEQGRAVQRERGEGGADDAIALYQQALEADPEWAAALWELGWSYQVKDDLDAALQAWDRLRELQPEYPELATYYPVLLMRHDQAKRLAALPDPGSLPPPEEEPRAGPTVSINAVGDVQLGRGWPEHRATLPPDNGADLFTAVAATLSDADVTFGNLETVLADDGESTKCGPKSTKCFAFRAPAALAETLKAAGFDVMSIANNHAGDFGQEGREKTMAALDQVGIFHSGPVGDLASWETNGLKIGLVAFSTGGGVYRIQEIETAQKVVAELDREHDLVIVSFHGGAEGAGAARVPKEVETFYGENRGDVHAFSHAVIDAGADLVLGHGPHRLRAMEIYRGRLIAYSLGNFSSWNTFNLSGDLGLTAILDAKLAPNGVLLSARVHPVQIIKPGRPQPDAEKRAIRIIRILSEKDFRDPIIDENGEYRRPQKVALDD